MNTNIPTDDMTMSLVPLDVFREIAGVNAYHFWQFEDPKAVDGADECDAHWVHYRWLINKGVGRFDILTALAKAEGRIADILHYWPFLKYEANERVTLQRPKPFLSYNQPQLANLNWGHIQNVGTQTWTSLASGTALAYTPSDDVIIVVALATAIVDLNEVVVCYPGTHVPIRPIYCTLSGLNLTIKIKKWLLGNSTTWSDRVTDNTVVKSTLDLANMLGTVDVYRVWMDTSQYTHAVFPDDCTCIVDCTTVAEDVCIVYIDQRSPQILWNAMSPNSFFGHSVWPYYLDISYQHGLNHGSYGSYMSWAAVISHYAMALLDDVGCDCKEADFTFRYWQQDLAHTGEWDMHSLSQAKLGNPFGTKRGAIDAWEHVRQYVGA